MKESVNRKPHKMISHKNINYQATPVCDGNIFPEMGP